MLTATRHTLGTPKPFVTNPRQPILAPPGWGIEGGGTPTAGEYQGTVNPGAAGSGTRSQAYVNGPMRWLSIAVGPTADQGGGKGGGTQPPPPESPAGAAVDVIAPPGGGGGGPGIDTGGGGGSSTPTTATSPTATVTVSAQPPIVEGRRWWPWVAGGIAVVVGGLVLLRH